MAIYIWKCKSCGHEHEIERPINQSDVPPDKCDGCGQRKHKLYYGDFWEKIITKTNFSLKGGGWFKDSYQKKGDKNDN